MALKEKEMCFGTLGFSPSAYKGQGQGALVTKAGTDKSKLTGYSHGSQRRASHQLLHFYLSCSHVTPYPFLTVGRVGLCSPLVSPSPDLSRSPFIVSRVYPKWCPLSSTPEGQSEHQHVFTDQISPPLCISFFLGTF